MVFNIIPFLLIIVSLIIIIFIIGKKIPELRILDVDTILEQKESNVKKKMLEVRWKRVIGKSRATVTTVLRPILGNMLYFFRNLYHRVLELEKTYSKEAQERKEHILTDSQRLEKYIESAREKQALGAFSEAEEYYIKALEIDDKNLEAYQGLGSAYIENKDYLKAQETFNFIIKLLSASGHDEDENIRHILASSHATLGEISQNINDNAGALLGYKKAVTLEPSNPKFLDLLLNFSIIIKDKKLAQRTLKQLKKSNPENNKIKEWEDFIGTL